MSFWEWAACEVIAVLAAAMVGLMFYGLSRGLFGFEGSEAAALAIWWVTTPRFAKELRSIDKLERD